MDRCEEHKLNIVDNTLRGWVQTIKLKIFSTICRAHTFHMNRSQQQNISMLYQYLRLD